MPDRQSLDILHYFPVVFSHLVQLHYSLSCHKVRIKWIYRVTEDITVLQNDGLNIDNVSVFLPLTPRYSALLFLPYAAENIRWTKFCPLFPEMHFQDTFSYNAHKYPTHYLEPKQATISLWIINNISELSATFHGDNGCLFLLSGVSCSAVHANSQLLTGVWASLRCYSGLSSAGI